MVERIESLEANDGNDPVELPPEHLAALRALPRTLVTDMLAEIEAEPSVKTKPRPLDENDSEIM